MALVEQDFLVEQGSTFILQFDLKKDDDTALTTTQTNQYTTIATTTDISLGMKVRKTKYGTNTYIITCPGCQMKHPNPLLMPHLPPMPPLPPIPSIPIIFTENMDFE
jgi:hypothetical protein